MLTSRLWPFLPSSSSSDNDQPKLLFLQQQAAATAICNLLSSGRIRRAIFTWLSHVEKGEEAKEEEKANSAFSHNSACPLEVGENAAAIAKDAESGTSCNLSLTIILPQLFDHSLKAAAGLMHSPFRQLARLGVQIVRSLCPFVGKLIFVSSIVSLNIF
ncbi:unnamed protein product [Protopolystoma xenopodis]|uniref:Uncharacterized protein n=1 Tax=Protopolystoma xenopodis TaxID=117903 RepID=A0A3S5CJG4_9PLAT|nr:unnamed protein product [Protopolystoma xenopodis]